MDTMTLSLYQTRLMLGDAHNDAQLVSDMLDAQRCSTMTFDYDARPSHHLCVTQQASRVHRAWYASGIDKFSKKISLIAAL
eukprot:3837256-Rhodomonas_salina.1